VKHLWMRYDARWYSRTSIYISIIMSSSPLWGASGCGKSTFLRLLLGVEVPSRGQLLIDGEPLVSEPGPDRGIVFQRYSLFPASDGAEEFAARLGAARVGF